MANWLKFVIALASAFLLMLAFRALAFTLYTVDGRALAPVFINGDRLIVSRWSYGLRIDGGRLLPYSRLLREGVRRGDIVAFDMPGDSVKGICVARYTAIPGDTIHTTNGPLIVPGRITCSAFDYYWLEAIADDNPVDSRHLGFISERNIIGRVAGILYSHDDTKNIFEGYSPERSAIW